MCNKNQTTKNLHNTKNLQIRIDADLKDQADKLFEDLGTSTNDAVKMFLKKAIRTNSIPFEVSAYTPNVETQKAIDAALADEVTTYKDTNELFDKLGI